MKQKNRYHIEVITSSGGYQGTVPYTIEAHNYSTHNNGYYEFYNISEENEYATITVSTFPITRTIIKKIEKL
jgi:hypothetical protein